MKTKEEKLKEFILKKLEETNGVLFVEQYEKAKEMHEKIASYLAQNEKLKDNKK